MSSNDGSDEKGYIDRMATHVYDPQGQPSPQRSGPPPQPAARAVDEEDDDTTLPPRPSGAYEQVLGADEPTPPPSSVSGAYEAVLGADEPTPPPSSVSGAYEAVLGADDPTPPPVSGPIPVERSHHYGHERSAFEQEDLSSIGFIPGRNFRAPEEASKKKPSPRDVTTRSITLAGRIFSLPSLTWLDDADTIQRAQYGGMGLIAGAVVGSALGVLNAFLQGWSLAAGSNQILALATLFGLICAVMAAMRPNRVDKILERLGIDN